MECKQLTFKHLYNIILIRGTQSTRTCYARRVSVLAILLKNIILIKIINFVPCSSLRLKITKL